MYEYMNMIQMIQNSLSVIVKFFCLGIHIINNAKVFDHYQQQCLHKRHFQHDSHRLGETYGDMHTVRG